MRLGRSLIDNPIYSSDEGCALGKVTDLYLDKDLTFVTALCLGGKGLLKRPPILIRNSDIDLFGIDIILTKSTAIVYRGDEIPATGQWIRLRDLQGREARTPGGTNIGRVRDVVLDAEARVTGLSLGRIAVEGPLAESKTVARAAVVDVGERDGALTVDLATAERELVKIDPDSLTFRPPAQEL